MNNGGNWFTCLGALASDDGSIANPEINKQFGFVKDHGEEAVREAVKSLSGKYETRR